jgi:hypothetical protein
MRTIVLVLSLLALSVLVGCSSRNPASPHARLADGVEPLRTAFNADAGKVRVVMLVAPT